MGEVKTKLTIIDNATTKLDKINQSVQRMTKNFTTLSVTGGKVGANLDKVGRQATSAATKVNQLRQAVQSANKTMIGNANVLGGYSASAKGASDATNGVVRSLKKLAAAYLGVMTARAALETADTITGSNNKLVTLGVTEYGMDKATAQKFSDDAMEKMFNAAQASATSYTDMMATVSKSVALVGKTFGKTQEQQINNAIAFQEIMAKNYALAGATGAEQSNSMNQLTQALGSGVLQGDELNSLRNGAPLAYQAIEKFAQGVLNTDKSLKKLAATGYITSDLVVAAILDMEGKTNEAFKNVDLTWGMIWTRFKNEVVLAFKPFFEKLKEVGNSKELQFFSEKVIQVVRWVADRLIGLLDVFQKVMSWASNHWEAFKGIVMAGIFLIGSAIIMHLVTSFTTFVNTLSVAQLKMWALIAIMTLIIVSIGFITDATGSLATALGAVAVMLGIILIIWSLITAGATITIALVIGLILLLLGVIVAFTEQVVGAVFWLGALIANIVIGLINALIQLIWNKFVEPFLGIIEWILNACNGGFNSFGGAVANLIGQIISWFLSLGKVVTKIIDAIFGTDWTGGLSKLQGEVISWGKNEESITIDRTAPELDRLNLTDAYDFGAGIGAGWHDKMDGMLNGIGKKVKDATNLGNLPNLDNIAIADPSGLLGDIGKGVDKTSKNTGKMAKDMKLTAEDLKYLRQVAEMEAINKFTTAEIKIDMTNNNTVNNTNDLDGIVTHLTTKLREELNVMAEGVHV